MKEIIKAFKLNNTTLNENFTIFRKKLGPMLKKVILDYDRDIIDFEDYAEVEDKFYHLMAKVGFRELGEGATRTTFTHPDRPELVLKVTHTAKGFEQNKLETKLGRSSKYADLFTKVFESDPEGLWLIAERVEPIDNERDYLEKVIPELYQAMLDWEWVPNQGAIYSLQQYVTAQEMAANYVKYRTAENPHGAGFQYKRTFNEVVDKHGEKETNKMAEYFFKKGSNKFLSRLYEAVIEHGVEIWDVRQKNVGLSLVDETPRLLDASVLI